MREISAFALAKHDGDYENWPRKTALFQHGIATDVEIQGYIIEAQYKVSDGYLLITSWDCLFEEANEYIWLNHNLRVMAHRRLGACYQSYVLAEHKAAGPASLQLNYIGDLKFSIELQKLGFIRRISLRRIKPSIGDDAR